MSHAQDSRQTYRTSPLALGTLVLTVAGVVAALALAGCFDSSELAICGVATCGGHGSCVDGPDGPTCNCETGYHAVGMWCVEDGADGDADSDSDSDVDGDGDGDGDADGDIEPDADEDVEVGPPPEVGDMLDLGTGTEPKSLPFGDVGMLVLALPGHGETDMVHYDVVDWDGANLLASLDVDPSGGPTDANIGDPHGYAACGSDPLWPWAIFWLDSDDATDRDSIIHLVYWDAGELSVVDITDDVLTAADNPSPRAARVVGDDEGCSLVWHNHPTFGPAVWTRHIPEPDPSLISLPVPVLEGAATTWIPESLDPEDGERPVYLMAAADDLGGVFVALPVRFHDDNHLELVGQRISMTGERIWEDRHDATSGARLFDGERVTTPSTMLGIMNPEPGAMRRAGSSVHYTVTLISDDPAATGNCLFSMYANVGTASVFELDEPTVDCSPNTSQSAVATARDGDTEIPIVMYWEWSGSMDPPMNIHLMGATPAHEVALDLIDAACPALTTARNGNLLLRWIWGDFGTMDFDIYALELTPDLEVVSGWPADGLVVRERGATESLGNDMCGLPGLRSGPEGQSLVVFDVANLDTGATSVRVVPILPGTE